MPFPIPDITVIVPFYNHARFVEKRLQSILQQTIGNLRLVLLDDASTDDTAARLARWQNHPQVQTVVINSTNSGSPFIQWKRGLDLVETEWVWIAEGDDFCETGFIESLLPVFSETGCVLAYNEIEWVDDAGRVIKPGKPGDACFYEGRQFLQQKMVMQDHLVNAGMVLFRKSAADNVDPRWLQMRQAGDYWFWCEIAAQGKVYASGQVLATFVRHPHALTTKQLNTEWQLQESLLVQDRMQELGMITLADIRTYLLTQLIGLETNKKALPSNEYKKRYQFWQEAAAFRGGTFAVPIIAFNAYIAKARHRFHKIVKA